MKRFIVTLMLAATLSTAVAQEQTKPEGYKFTDGTLVKSNSVKNQFRSGTCWCYSALSFIEEEIMRAGGESLDLSEMWIVRNIYFEKAVKYVRLHGALNFAVGGAAHDVIEGIKRYGIVPEEVYRGLNYGTELPHFNEVDAVLKAYVDAIIKAPNKKLTTAWQAGLNGILDAYFGKMPETFTYNGKEYTPHSFAASLPVDMNNYVSVSSYTHHPFYEQFVIEVPDNWMWGTVYNLPMEEMMGVLDNALKGGYSVMWAADVSEKGFNRTKAIGVIPEDNIDNMSGTDAERWGSMTEKERQEALYSFDKPGREKKITQQMRQEAFDNYETTDDHGMVIHGTATDQCGNLYYKVKNSWGVRPPYEGYYYFSRPFVEYKTMSFMVNKNAIPKGTRKALGL
ncbi:MAG: aminopeptidase [Alistipes sp.]|nr:aminopeptidase [Alistipes sp.]